jgi:hypothetical protein
MWECGLSAGQTMDSRKKLLNVGFRENQRICGPADLGFCNHRATVSQTSDGASWAAFSCSLRTSELDPT